MPLVEYILHIELWIVGELEACYLGQDVYRSSHEMRDRRSYRNLTPCGDCTFFYS